MSPTAAPQRPRAVTVTAPGKLILAGEHAAVYGRPALVAAVDLRLVARAETAWSPGAEAPPAAATLDLADLGLRESIPVAGLRDYAARAEERWQEFAADPTPERFRALRGSDPAHLVKVALGEVLRAHGAEVATSFGLRIESRIPVGSGMGSSAATSAAVVVAALRLFGREAGLGRVEPLVLAAERRQHGSPSGVDGAVILRGGVQWVEREREGGLRFTALPADLPLLNRLRVLDTGSPAQPTGEVVTAVRQLQRADPSAFERLLDALEDATRGLRDALAAGDGGALAAAIRAAHRGLVEAGVVPPGVRALVARVEAAGGAAKISGAGALAGAGAGCVVIYHPSPGPLDAHALGAARPLLEVRLGAPGVREERS